MPGIPTWLWGKPSTCQCRRPRFDPWVGKIPWRRKRQPTPVFLPGKSHGHRSLAGYSPLGHKVSDTTELLRTLTLTHTHTHTHTLSHTLTHTLSLTHMHTHTHTHTCTHTHTHTLSLTHTLTHTHTHTLTQI